MTRNTNGRHGVVKVVTLLLSSVWLKGGYQSVGPKRMRPLVVTILFGLIVIVCTPWIYGWVSVKTVVDYNTSLGGEPLRTESQVLRWGPNAGEEHGVVLQYFPNSSVVYDRSHFRNGRRVGVRTIYDRQGRPRRVMKKADHPGPDGFYDTAEDTSYDEAGRIVEQKVWEGDDLVRKVSSPPWLWGKEDL